MTARGINKLQGATESKISKSTQLILNTMDALQNSKGSSLQEIANFLASNGADDSGKDLRKVKLALKKAIDFGVVKKTREGLYTIQNEGGDTDALMRANRRRRRAPKAMGRRRRRRGASVGGRRRRRTVRRRRTRGGRRRAGRSVSRRRRRKVAKE